MFFGYLKFLRYEVLSPQRRYAISVYDIDNLGVKMKLWRKNLH